MAWVTPGPISKFRSGIIIQRTPAAVNWMQASGVWASLVILSKWPRSWRHFSFVASTSLRRGACVTGTLLACLFAAFSSAPSEASCRLTEVPENAWRLTVVDGVSWLVNPCGELFFSLGVNMVSGGGPRREAGGRIYYYWPHYYPDFSAWARATSGRLREWGFNTLGAWSVSPQQLNLPTMIELSLGKDIGFLWNDPFNPVEEARLREAARRGVRPWRGSAYRIGYFSDNEVGWWNGPMFTVYSSFPPENYSKRRLVSLLREYYRDDWSKFILDFVPARGVDGFDALIASRVPIRMRPGGAGIRVVRRWTTEVARQYYRIVAQEIRASDPGALFFGDRLPIYYDPDAVRAMTPYVDAIAVNYNADGPDGWIAPYFFEGLRQLTGGKPVMVTEWFFAAHENRSGNLNRTGLPNEAGKGSSSNNINRTGHLMTVATQAERAAGAAAAARRMAAEPNVVGLHWFQYSDEPRGGRYDGEDYNFGLVDIDDRPYEALIATFTNLNPLLAQVHRQGAKRPKGHVIPYGAINPLDNSLVEWPKDEALLWPLLPHPGEAVFGDVYMAWDERGLSLATIAMDFYDPLLLRYEADFPRDEAFRIDLGVDAGAGPRHFHLEVEPVRPSRPEEKIGFRSRLCAPAPEGCVVVPGAQSTYFGVALDQPRVIVEGKLPWSAMGVEKPPTASVKAEISVTAFYRSRWMSLSGLSPTEGGANPAGWMLLSLTRRR